MKLVGVKGGAGGVRGEAGGVKGHLQGAEAAVQVIQTRGVDELLVDAPQNLGRGQRSGGYTL